MTWFYLALTSAFIFAAQELLMRVLSVQTGSPRLFSLVFNLWGTVFSAALFVIERGSFAPLTALSITQYLWIAAALLLYGIYERSQFFARQGQDAATFTVIMRINTVVGFFGAIAFLGEPLTLAKAAGVTMVILASLLLVFHNPHFKFSKSFFYTLLCAVALGMVGFVDKPASAPVPPTLYSFLVWCLPLGIIAFPGVSRKDLIKEMRIGGWKVALAAILNVVGYVIYINALSMSDASRVNPITATYSILTVLGGVVLLRERDHYGRKILAGLIACIGVILLK